MNFSKPISYEAINVLALAVAIVFLPFSIAVCHAGLLILVASWLMEGKWRIKWDTIKNQPLLWPFLLFFILHLTGLIYSNDIGNGTAAIGKKTFFFLLPIIIATLKIERNHLHLLLKLFLGTSLVAVVICISAAFNQSLHPDHTPRNFDFTNSEEFNLLNPDISQSWSYFSYSELSSGINIHPTYLGLYITFSTLLLAHFYKQRENSLTVWEKRGILFVFLLFSLFILLLSSRAITIAYLFSSIAGFSWIFFYPQKSAFAITGIIVVILLSAASIFLNPISRYRSIQEFNGHSLRIETNKQYITSSSIRLSLWWLGLQSITPRNWVIGNGTGDTTDTMKATAEKYGITNTLHSYDPHNQFIYTFLQLGIIGLFTLTACLLLPCFQQSISFLHLSFLIIILIVAITESIFELQKGIVFFSLFHSLIIFQFQTIRSPQLSVSHA